jgi:Transport and Golgi organisation 2
MCVLTYFPYGKDRFVLTSNRDEKVLRQKALPPKKLKIGKTELIAPLDPISKGTWIATSKEYSAVLLNGGFVCHTSQPPYRKSRGQVIPDLATFKDAKDFYQNYNFEGIEPFTLLIFEHGEKREIFEIRWCNNQKFFKKIDETQPEIWSSATLYTPEATAKRKAWYFHLIAQNNNHPLPSTILDFHIHGGKEDSHDSIHLRRSEELKTLSTTQISIDAEGHTMVYQDFLQDINKVYRII